MPYPKSTLCKHCGIPFSRRGLNAHEPICEQKQIEKEAYRLYEETGDERLRTVM